MSCENCLKDRRESKGLSPSSPACILFQCRLLRNVCSGRVSSRVWSSIVSLEKQRTACCMELDATLLAVISVKLHRHQLFFLFDVVHSWYVFSSKPRLVNMMQWLDRMCATWCVLSDSVHFSNSAWKRFFSSSDLSLAWPKFVLPSNKICSFQRRHYFLWQETWLQQGLCYGGDV